MPQSQTAALPDPKRKRKPTNPNKHKSNKRTKSTKISSLFPKRGNRNTKRTEKHKNKMTHGKTYNKSPRFYQYFLRSGLWAWWAKLAYQVMLTIRGRLITPFVLGSIKGKRKVQGVPQSKPQPFPDPKRKRKPTTLNKHKPNKRTKSTKISSLFPKRGNRNTKRTENTRTKCYTERHTTNRFVE